MNRRTFFAKLLAGIAALPIIGKLCAGSKQESHVVNFEYGPMCPKNNGAPWLNTADGKWYVSNGGPYEEMKLSEVDQARVDSWAKEIVAQYLPPA